MAFIDRERELAALEALWRREGAQLMVVYGRRRTGKTALLHAFTQDKPTVFWTAEITSATNLLRSFSRTLWSYANPKAHADEDFAFGSWEQALRYAGQIAEKNRVAVVLADGPAAIWLRCATCTWSSVACRPLSGGRRRAARGAICCAITS